ncbi:MAG TPA: chemotaxis protein CheW [Vicinamibacteria bacterium]|nr:chemotaxis protein CheW [Vicinamibacteria bacterium]
MDPQLDLEPVRAAFLAETDEDLRTVEQALLQLEKTPDGREPVAVVFRKFHTLKGNASALGLEKLSALAHRLEDLLDRLRSGREPVSAALVTFLLQTVDAVRGSLPAAAAGRDEITPAAEKLQAQVASGRLTADEGSSTGRAAGAGPEAEASRTLRVEVSRLDTLLSVTSEIAVARGRLELLIREQGTPEIAGAYRGLERLLGEMHRCVSVARMVPVTPLLQLYDRLVRDLALEQGKRARLVVFGEGVEADNSVVEQLRAPLTHMVRNAVDHGLETPPAREASGKDPTGEVRLTARQEGSEVVVEVEDDGAGLDRRRILERARVLGIDTDALTSQRAVDRLIFSQGLSTSGYVTGTSGRGVGLDVVLRHVDALGGAVEVESEAGRGTRFTLRLPVTLAAIEGLLARLGEASVVIPMAGVVRCVELPPEAAREAADGVLNLDGQAIPYARLRGTFCPGADGGSRGDAAREIAVIVEKGHDRFGLAVDQLVGRAQVVVKAPGRFFKGLPAVSGLTILGDGRVAPVLNVAGLLQQHQRRGGAEAVQQPAEGQP